VEMMAASYGTRALHLLVCITWMLCKFLSETDLFVHKVQMDNIPAKISGVNMKAFTSMGITSW